MRRIHRRTSASTVPILLLTLAAYAQPPLSLQNALATTRSSHPLLQAAPNRVAAAEGGILQAGLRPNPRLFLQTENWRGWSTPGLTPGDQTDTYAYLTQPFETGGKRARRMELAQAIAGRARLERELVEKQVLSRVKQAYWNAAAAARIHAALEENVRNFQQIVGYHDIRVREGAVAEADLLRVRLEGERLALAANTAGLEAERARIELFRAMGQTQFPEVTFADALEAPVQPPPADVTRALAERTEIKIAAELRSEALANVRLQQANAKPDIDGLLGYKRTVGFNTVLGGVQINLPFSNRNQGNIASAEASVRIAESEAAATEALVRAELRGAERDVAIRGGQVSGTLQKLLSQASESSRIAQAAYREGGADLLRLLDAERVRIELEALYYRTLGDYRQSIVALEAAMGVIQ